MDVSNADKGSRGWSPGKLPEFERWGHTGSLQTTRVKIQEVFSKLPESTGITGFHQIAKYITPDTNAFKNRLDAFMSNQDIMFDDYRADVNL